MNLWLGNIIENRKRLRNTLYILGYGDFPQLETMQFVPGWTGFTIAGGIELDILTEMKGLENFTFSESLSMASIAEMEGVKVPFLHINQLIKNKKTINRPKDQVDVIELEKIRRIRGGEA